ncbi:hypothetical protein AK830_g7535 [Neonectria ditissima]|uniref:Zn(2)-C6 fungal-type domain-containing protein n=1 Tax=Neonectria ditissima TaxID=78410 RepID=A0A0P7BDM6_9HYPO|nr:hypothetical protein AK830_g7535 [Neonectria ditissima]
MSLASLDLWTLRNHPSCPVPSSFGISNLRKDMFITLKSSKSGAKEVGMEQVALSQANHHAARNRFGPNRRDACVGCRSKKLRCTGSSLSCDRCNVQQIACVFPQAPGHRRPRKTGPASSIPRQTALLDNAQKNLPRPNNHEPTQACTLDPVDNANFAGNSIHNDHQHSVRNFRVSETEEGFSASSGIESGDLSPVYFQTDSTGPVSATVEASAPTGLPSNRTQPMAYMANDCVQPVFPETEETGTPSLDMHILPEFSGPAAPLIANPIPETPLVQPSNQSTGCTCISDTLDVVQKLDDDYFQLRTLAFDHVLKLQKWLIFNCCKPLDCNKCTNLLQTYTIILIICDRVTEMFKCLSKRIKLPHTIPSSGGDAMTVTPDTTTPSPSATLTNDEALLSGQSAAQLFDSLSGDAGIKTRCNAEMFSPEFRAQYSYDEQLHMIRVLAKIQVRNFNQLLVRIGGMHQSQHNQARFGKICSLIKRLQESGDSMDESFRVMLEKFEG